MRRRKTTIQAKTLSRRFDSGPPSFLPTSISGCQLWLDGADSSSSSMILSGSNVTTWKDKSGNGKNATASGTPTYVTGGGVNFNGSSYFLNQTFTMNLSQRSIFIVMQETVYSPNSGVIIFIPTPNTGDDSGSTSSMTSEIGFPNKLWFYGNSDSYRSMIGSTVTPLQRSIYHDSMNGTVGSGFLNGTNATNNTAGYTAATCSGYALGGRWQGGSMSASYRLNGVIYEILVYNTALSTIQRQKIEGYLAHKWGLQTSLPTGHRYKTTAPTGATIPFVPNFIPGNQLWLDGADSSSSSMVLSGSSVTSWKDKSGSLNHFTPTSGTPTSISDNGRNVVNFTSGTIMTSTNQITFTTSSAFFIVSRLTSVTAANAGMLLGFTNINGADKSIRFYGPIGRLAGTVSEPGDNAYELANATYFVNGTFNPSFGTSTYFNVYSLIGTVAPTGGGTSFLTLSSSFMSRFFIGNIAEFLYYPTGVSTIDRQEIEGYLAHKWGLESTLPAGHPYKTTPPSG